jgi:hypothetical protein
VWEIVTNAEESLPLLIPQQWLGKRRRRKNDVEWPAINHDTLVVAQFDIGANFIVLVAEIALERTQNITP